MEEFVFYCLLVPKAIVQKEVVKEKEDQFEAVSLVQILECSHVPSSRKEKRIFLDLPTKPNQED